jgi:TolB-like protein
MPSYFFTVEGRVQLDDLPAENLADDEAARALAQSTADELAKDAHRFHGCRVVARNQSGNIVAEAVISGTAEPGSVLDRLLKLKPPRG